MNSVVVLGAGMVSGPLVRYLLEKGYYVTVASRTVEKAVKVTEGHPKGRPISFDITRDSNLKELISEHDMAVSLLPYIHHVKVAKACIDLGIPMVTTSYVSEDMKRLDEEAVDSGILLLNEMGLDPGIDHMEAQRMIDDVHRSGGSVVEFISYCGGLPAPEANTNPWGYKFSWSPRGVVLAGKNTARFMKGGVVKTIPGKELFANYEIIPIPDLDEFEGYPNRDSLPYADVYGIQEAKTVFRGTLRNKGWCDTWKALHDTGILEETKTQAETYHELMDHLLPGEGDLKVRLRDTIDTRNDELAISNFEWLGLLSDRRIIDDSSRLDALSSLLNDRLVYSEGERDMIILRHTFVLGTSEGGSTHHSTMVDFGIPGGDSAMSRTVGLPAGIGTHLILSGKLEGMKGVQIPTHPRIYEPALKELRELGIEFVSA